MSKIEPKILKGFRDFLPEKQIARQTMMSAIRASYERFGFEPLETPVLEYAETLTGKYGDEGDKLMYRFKDNGDRDVAMRYDLTIPLARVVAMNGELKKPFKRYQIAPVWRAENTQKGRYREFYQCDADIVGTVNPLADAEILAVASNALRGLDIEDFIIYVNSREIISSFYDSLGLSAEQKVAAIRSVDKFYKIGREGVEQELKDAGMERQAEKIITFAEVSIDCIVSRGDIGKIAEEFPMIKAPLGKLISIVDSAFVLAPKTKFVLDFSIARGLDYYTGLIFETKLTSNPQFGSILSGGRYDNLVGVFSNKSVPAVGCSIGVDRLFAALEELKLLKEAKTTADAFIVNLDESLTGEYLSLASQLRNAGINTILYFDAVDMKKQLSYASDKGIRYALIYGSNEAKTGTISVKDLEKGTQESVSRKEIVKYIKG